MNNRLFAPLAWLLICGLWLVIIAALVIWWPLNLIASGALWIGEWARDRIEGLSE